MVKKFRNSITNTEREPFPRRHCKQRTGETSSGGDNRRLAGLFGNKNSVDFNERYGGDFFDTEMLYRSWSV